MQLDWLLHCVVLVLIGSLVVVVVVVCWCCIPYWLAIADGGPDLVSPHTLCPGVCTLHLFFPSIKWCKYYLHMWRLSWWCFFIQPLAQTYTQLAYVVILPAETCTGAAMFVYRKWFRTNVGGWLSLTSESLTHPLQHLSILCWVLQETQMWEDTLLI